jgi:hypothetical protein
MILAHITCQSAMNTSDEFPFFRRLGYHSEGPWVFLVRAGKGTRMSFLHGTFPPQPPCSDLEPHATALPCLPACPPSGLAGRTRHRCPPSQTEKHVCPVPKAITFQTEAPWGVFAASQVRARLSEDFQVLERKPKPEKAPKAIPEKCQSKTSLPLSPHPSWTVGSSQTSLQAWLFQLPSGLVGEKVGNPLFISQSVKRSTYFR